MNGVTRCRPPAPLETDPSLRLPLDATTPIPEQLRYRPGRLREQFLIDDEVATEDRVGLVAGDLHRDRLLHTRPDQVPDRGAPEVVQELALQASRPARTHPRTPQLLDRMAAPVEHARTKPLVLAFPTRNGLSLLAKHLFHPRVILEREDPWLSILRVSQPDGLTLPVHV